jgi:hypothetical protein
MYGYSWEEAWHEYRSPLWAIVVSGVATSGFREITNGSLLFARNAKVLTGTVRERQRRC